ncbi:hypothetical protein BpHYR1_039618, partial [Brachionus plicatilis]
MNFFVIFSIFLKPLKYSSSSCKYSCDTEVSGWMYVVRLHHISSYLFCQSLYRLKKKLIKQNKNCNLQFFKAYILFLSKVEQNESEQKFYFAVPAGFFGGLSLIVEFSIRQR